MCVCVCVKEREREKERQRQRTNGGNTPSDTTPHQHSPSQSLAASIGKQHQKKNKVTFERPWENVSTVKLGKHLTILGYQDALPPQPPPPPPAAVSRPRADISVL